MSRDVERSLRRQIVRRMHRIEKELLGAPPQDVTGPGLTVDDLQRMIRQARFLPGQTRLATWPYLPIIRRGRLT